MSQEVQNILLAAGLSVNASVVDHLVERHADRDPVKAAETAASWAADPEMRTKNAASLLRAALERAPRRATDGGRLRCNVCKIEFDPSEATINGLRVCPSAYCNDCLGIRFAAGCWQEKMMYDVAKEDE